MKLMSELSVLSALLLLASCAEKVEETPVRKELGISPTSLQIPQSGGEAAAQVKSNTDWTAAASSDWLEVLPSNGNGDATITLKAGENTGQQREGTITGS